LSALPIIGDVHSAHMTNAIIAILAAAVPMLSIIGVIYRRFVKTASNELEPFSRYVSRGVKYYVGRYVRRQLSAELTLRQYARACLKSSAAEMVVPARYPVQLRVDDVFVPLLLQGAAGETTNHTDLLGRRRARVAIVGEPGSGKSSLMKRLFRDACRKANHNPRQSPLPILFELRELGRLPADELQALTHERLLELCTRAFSNAAVYRADAALEHLAHGAGYLLLLDGLDEVPSDAAASVVRTICDLSAALDQTSLESSIIVSTRTQHYLALHQRTFKEIFRPFTIQSFSPADVYRFLLKWPFRTDRKLQVTRLFSRIRSLPSLAEMCTNPLALSMFVARDQQTGGAAAPETRSAFYAALVEELLVNRRARSHETEAGHQRLLRQREAILGEACLEHLLDPDDSPNSLTAGRLIAAVERGGAPSDRSPSVLAELAIDTGLFSEEREGETFRFLHLTLCEFLAAREVVNRGPEGWRAIQSRLASQESGAEAAGVDWSSRLAEVTAFACGLAPRATCEAILQDLADNDEPVVLLKAAIEAQSYDHRASLDAITKVSSTLAAQSPSDWDLAWFAELRWLIAVLRDIAASTSGRLDIHADTAMPKPADYLIALIDRHGAEDLLLATLARQDADAAIAIAEGSDRPSLMDIVAGAIDDYSVFVGIMARCEARQWSWAHVLVHVALRQHAIAELLLASTDQLGGAAPSQRRWAAAPPLRGSTYGRLIDEVLQAPAAGRDDDREHMEALSRVTPPRSDIAYVLRPSIVLGGVFAAGLIAAGFIYGPTDRGPIEALRESFWQLLFTVSAFVTSYVIFRALAGERWLRILWYHWAQRGRHHDRAAAEGFPAGLDLAPPRFFDDEPLSRALVLSEIFNLNPTAAKAIGMASDGALKRIPDRFERALAGTRLPELRLARELHEMRMDWGVREDARLYPDVVAESPG
jgi:hypothetical protein